MKVPSVNFNITRTTGVYKNTGRIKSEDLSAQNSYSNDYPSSTDSLSKLSYLYPIPFTSIQNSSKLRILFGYGLPCMYSGVKMIDPKVLSRMLKNNTFYRRSSEVVDCLEKFKDSFNDFNYQIFLLLKERSKVYPDKNIQQLLKGIEPIYKRDLRKTQAPIFHELSQAAVKLPTEYRIKFNKLMVETDKKLNEKPLTIPFSSYEFKYKLSKINEDMKKVYGPKAAKVLKKLMKESQRFANTTDSHTIDQQKKVLKFIEYIVKKSVLHDNERLVNLIRNSKSRLENTEIIAPFTRKAFLYDLDTILSGVEDKSLRDKMMEIAQKLPTSGKNFSAYVLKLASDAPDKIGHRMMWPALASIEHIHPRSCNGQDIMANYGGATTSMNSARKSIPFTLQMELVPQTGVNCQKYVDALIDLYHKGVFKENNINPNYIKDFAATIYEESNHTLKLDLSRM